jgi:hypothetical protein
MLMIKTGALKKLLSNERAVILEKTVPKGSQRMPQSQWWHVAKSMFNKYY